MNLKPLVLAGIIFIATRAAKKADTVNNFKFSLDGIPTFSFGGAGLLIGLPVGIDNNSNERVAVKKVFGSMLVNGSLVSNFETDANIAIEKFSHQTVAVRVSTALTNAAAALIRALTSKGGDVLTVEGTVVTDLLNIPFRVTKNLS